MASVTVSYTITIPSMTTLQIVDAICNAYDYQSEVNGAPNPESKADFAKRMAGLALVDTIKRSLVKNALETARESVDQVTSTITIS